MCSVIKKADPPKWRFPQTPQNGGFRMLLKVMKMSQSVQLLAATTVSSLCVTHVMQSQPGNGVSCFQWVSGWLPFQDCSIYYKHCVILSKFWVVYYQCLCCSPSKWWKFAITAQLETIHDRNQRHSMKYVVARVHDINTYAEAFTEYLALDPRYIDDELKVHLPSTVKSPNTSVLYFTWHHWASVSIKLYCKFSNLSCLANDYTYFHVSPPPPPRDNSTFIPQIVFE